MECIVCGKETEEEKKYCKYHGEAHSKLYETYERWREARPISWKEYLDEVYERDETGKWVREIIDHIMQ
ncbi:MAG: hypothetical protein BAJATHORv1_20322 [Candidatus Thorarchaeota archaeon]|nr:MAG: hypothetical protein BAJATHORv1_20322 [Candidatus Thorarchaeota archaeon]